MIKILHFLTDSNIGGAGRLLCNLIKNMNIKYYKIYVALPEGSALIKELENLPCTVIACRQAPDKSISLDGIIEDYQIIKNLRPDIVHSHASLSSRIAATLLNVPSRIFTRHCAFPVSRALKNPLTNKIVGKANDILSTKIIAVADAAKQNLIEMGCDKNKIVTVINGVEPMPVLSDGEKRYFRARLGIEEKDFVVTILARLEEYKGHSTLLRAAKICVERYPNFKFLIVGDGKEKNALKRLCSELNIEKNVLFLGFCDDVSPILNITGVNVNCSFGTETSSLAISEGMSLAIPCVASDYGGNPHMVKNEVNGLLFPQKNAEVLAKSLIRLYSDRALYEKCSLGAYMRFHKEFNAKIMAEKMTSIYKSEYRKHQKPSRLTSKI